MRTGVTEVTWKWLFSRLESLLRLIRATAFKALDCRRLQLGFRPSLGIVVISTGFPPDRI